MSELNHSPTHLLADVPAVNATPGEVTDLLAEMFYDVDNNDYLNAHGFENMTVNVLNNNAYLGPTQCDYSAAMVICSPEKLPANMLAMVRNVRGAYEDVLIATSADGAVCGDLSGVLKFKACGKCVEGFLGVFMIALVGAGNAASIGHT